MGEVDADLALSLKDLLPLLAALVGGLIGAVGGNVVKYRLDVKLSERRRTQDAKVLCDSLRGEVKSLRGQLKTYRRATGWYLEDVYEHRKAVQAGYRVSGMRHDLGFFAEVKTPVYDANVARIGLLWNVLSREVVEFYSDFLALQKFAERTASSKPDEVFKRRAKLFYKEANSLVSEATELNRRMNQFSQGDERVFKEDRKRRVKFLTQDGASNFSLLSPP